MESVKSQPWYCCYFRLLWIKAQGMTHCGDRWSSGERTSKYFRVTQPERCRMIFCKFSPHEVAEHGVGWGQELPPGWRGFGGGEDQKRQSLGTTSTGLLRMCMCVARSVQVRTLKRMVWPLCLISPQLKASDPRMNPLNTGTLKKKMNITKISPLCLKASIEL